MKEGRREDKAFIYWSLHLHSPGFITNQFNDQLPLDWLAQICYNAASVSKAGKGSNPGKPEVFQALFSQLHKSVPQFLRLTHLFHPFIKNLLFCPWITHFSIYTRSVILVIQAIWLVRYLRLWRFSKIQLVVYYQCCVLIGWASTRLYVIAH